MKARSLESLDSEQNAVQIWTKTPDDSVESTLKGLRNASGLTQSELAERLGMTQAQVSQIESRNDFLVSTMRRYIEALGGRLDICANFDEKRIKPDNM